MNYEIKPQIGYGPIKFGMSPNEVRAFLGKPRRTEAAVHENQSDQEEFEHYGNQHYEWYGQSDEDLTFPQITYADNKVIGITIFKQSGSLVYMGMDLHKKKNTRHYFFPKSGLIVPKVEHMKRFFFIQLVLTENQMPHLDFEMYEPSTALD